MDLKEQGQIDTYLDLSFKNESLERSYLEHLQVKEELTFFSRLKLVNLYALFSISVNLWVYCNMLFKSDYARLKIEKFQARFSIAYSFIWLLHTIISFLIGRSFEKKGWQSEKTLRKITIQRIIMIGHYIILSLEFVVLHAPSFGLLK